MDYNKYYEIQKNEAGEISGGWANQMVNAFKEFLENKNFISKILDIGCAYGTGILEMQKLGYTNLIGIDLIKEKVDYGKNLGLNLFEMDMHNLTFEDNFFDYSFMSHSIEHSLDPIKSITEMIRVTKKEALIIAPIEESYSTDINSPHTSPFYSEQEWIDLVKKIDNNSVKIVHKNNFRLGKEVWTYFSK